MKDKLNKTLWTLRYMTKDKRFENLNGRCFRAKCDKDDKITLYDSLTDEELFSSELMFLKNSGTGIVLKTKDFISLDIVDVNLTIPSTRETMGKLNYFTLEDLYKFVMSTKHESNIYRCDDYKVFPYNTTKDGISYSWKYQIIDGNRYDEDKNVIRSICIYVEDDEEWRSTLGSFIFKSHKYNKDTNIEELCTEDIVVDIVNLFDDFENKNYNNKNLPLTMDIDYLDFFSLFSSNGDAVKDIISFMLSNQVEVSDEIMNELKRFKTLRERKNKK